MNQYSTTSRDTAYKFPSYKPTLAPLDMSGMLADARATSAQFAAMENPELYGGEIFQGSEEGFHKGLAEMRQLRTDAIEAAKNGTMESWLPLRDQFYAKLEREASTGFMGHNKRMVTEGKNFDQAMSQLQARDPNNWDKDLERVMRDNFREMNTYQYNGDEHGKYRAYRPDLPTVQNLYAKINEIVATNLPEVYEVGYAALMAEGVPGDQITDDLIATWTQRSPGAIQSVIEAVEASPAWASTMDQYLTKNPGDEAGLERLKEVYRRYIKLGIRGQKVDYQGVPRAPEASGPSYSTRGRDPEGGDSGEPAKSVAEETTIEYGFMPMEKLLREAGAGARSYEIAKASRFGDYLSEVDSLGFDMQDSLNANASAMVEIAQSGEAMLLTGLTVRPLAKGKGLHVDDVSFEFVPAVLPYASVKPGGDSFEKRMKDPKYQELFANWKQESGNANATTREFYNHLNKEITTFLDASKETVKSQFGERSVALNKINENVGELRRVHQLQQSDLAAARSSLNAMDVYGAVVKAQAPDLIDFRTNSSGESEPFLKTGIPVERLKELKKILQPFLDQNNDTGFADIVSHLSKHGMFTNVGKSNVLNRGFNAKGMSAEVKKFYDNAVTVRAWDTKLENVDYRIKNGIAQNNALIEDRISTAYTMNTMVDAKVAQQYGERVMQMVSNRAGDAVTGIDGEVVDQATMASFMLGMRGLREGEDKIEKIDGDFSHFQFKVYTNKDTNEPALAVTLTNAFKENDGDSGLKANSVRSRTMMINYDPLDKDFRNLVNEMGVGHHFDYDHIQNSYNQLPEKASQSVDFGRGTSTKIPVLVGKQGGGGDRANVTIGRSTYDISGGSVSRFSTDIAARFANGVSVDRQVAYVIKTRGLFPVDAMSFRRDVETGVVSSASREELIASGRYITLPSSDDIDKALRDHRTSMTGGLEKMFQGYGTNPTQAKEYAANLAEDLMREDSSILTPNFGYRESLARAENVIVGDVRSTVRQTGPGTADKRGDGKTDARQNGKSYGYARPNAEVMAANGYKAPAATKPTPWVASTGNDPDLYRFLGVESESDMSRFRSDVLERWTKMGLSLVEDKKGQLKAVDKQGRSVEMLTFLKED